MGLVTTMQIVQLALLLIFVSVEVRCESKCQCSGQRCKLNHVGKEWQWKEKDCASKNEPCAGVGVCCVKDGTMVAVSKTTGNPKEKKQTGSTPLGKKVTGTTPLGKKVTGTTAPKKKEPHTWEKKSQEPHPQEKKSQERRHQKIKEPQHRQRPHRQRGTGEEKGMALQLPQIQLRLNVANVKQ